VRRILFSILLSFFACKCSAQDSTRVRNRLTGTIVENFYVLKSDKQIKSGQYVAVYRHSTALASGRYSNNKKVGTWHFYDTGGTLIENFDYNRNVLLYERPDDTVSEQQIRYAFDDAITDSTHVTKPISPAAGIMGIYHI
jgi:hypothetical protein